VILGIAQPGEHPLGSRGSAESNDGFIAIARERHPSLLGQTAAAGWADVFEAVQVLLSAALAGKAVQLRDCVGVLDGPSGPEERIFDANWSPLRTESGDVVGTLQTLFETTERHRFGQRWAKAKSNKRFCSR
jgi:hypothetical protein